MRWYVLSFLMVFFACQEPTAQSEDQQMSDEAPTYDMIIELHKQLLTSASDEIDTELAGRILEMSEQFSAANSTDTLSAEILFKAGDIARGMRSYGKAIQLWAFSGARSFNVSHRSMPKT